MVSVGEAWGKRTAAYDGGGEIGPARVGGGERHLDELGAADVGGGIGGLDERKNDASQKHGEGKLELHDRKNGDERVR